MKIMQGLNPLYHQVSSEVTEVKDNFVLITIVVQDVKTSKYYRTSIFVDVISEEGVDFREINNPEAPVFVEVEPKTITVYEQCTTDSQSVSRN